MFLDPTGTVSVSLPPGWAIDPLSSSLTDLVFVDWCATLPRQVFIHVHPARCPPSADDSNWAHLVEESFPKVVTRAERREGPTIWVERPGEEERPDQRWVIVRGTRLDVTIEQVGVPLGGSLSTPELKHVLSTLRVTPNERLLESHSLATMQKLMMAANTAYHAGDAATAGEFLNKAIGVARDTWRHSLTEGSLPNFGAALALIDAFIAMTHMTGSVLFLRQATDIAYRANASLRTFPIPGGHPFEQQLAVYFEQLMNLHVVEPGDSPPGNPLSAYFKRSQMLLNEFMEVLQGDNPKIATPWASLALEDAMSTMVLFRNSRSGAAPIPADVADRLSAQSLTDPASQAEAADKAIEAMFLAQLVAAGAALQSAKTFAGLDADRGSCHNWLLAAQRLVEISPTPDNERSVVVAMTALAGAYVTLGDEPSLSMADELLSDAEEILDKLGETGELRAQIALNQGWVRYNRRELDGSLDVLDRAIEEARSADSERLVRALRSLRSQFLGVMGKSEEAIIEARKAIGGSNDDAVSAHHLNLAIALHQSGQDEEALEEIQSGLAAAIADQPLGGEVLRLLYVSAVILEADDPQGSLAATEAAEAVMDARRLRHGDAADLIAFDDAIHHRELAATLVQRRLAADDILGALSSADRHRARSLVDASGDKSSIASHGADSSSPAALDKGTSLAEQIDYLNKYSRAQIAKAGFPEPLDGAALADIVANQGRTAILFHPGGAELLIFVVKPGESVGIITATAGSTWEEILELTEQLRGHLGISVASRTARGELPPQSIEDLSAAFADDDTSDESDTEFERLREALHDALFSQVLPFLGAAEPIVVVPYRELAVIPLAILTDENGRSLVSRHPLSVLPSLSSLKSLASVSEEKPRAVVVGNPTLPKSHGLASLPGAAEEAKHVQALLTDAGISTQPMYDAEATEKALRKYARGARIVHLACHAALRQPASMSPLFLSPSDSDDGLLLPAEIADLQLDGALVVLAACQSGLGRTTSDGVLGLGRAFVNAGARAVVLSLWRVGDKATERMMTALYEGLLGAAPDLEGPLDLARAVQRAQLLVAENIASHPSSWGPWLVVGDGGWKIA